MNSLFAPHLVPKHNVSLVRLYKQPAFGNLGKKKITYPQFYKFLKDAREQK